MFSWSGHTLTAAQHLNDIVDADFFRIERAEPYTTNCNEVVDVAQAEQNADARPALAQTVEDWDSYSTIYLGFPVWWYDAPQIVKTFMDAIAPGATFTRSVTIDGDAASSQLTQLDTWQAGLGL